MTMCHILPERRGWVNMDYIGEKHFLCDISLNSLPGLTISIGERQFLIQTEANQLVDTSWSVD